MKGKFLGLVAAGLLAGPMTAQASLIFSDGFEGTGASSTILNWTGGTNWTVMSGTVDLVKNGDYGITCAGGTGFCVDMDGSTGKAGDMVSLNVGPLAAGTYTFSYDLSGNQRANGFADTVVAYVEFGLDSWATSLAYNAGWQTFTRTITLSAITDPVYLRFAATGGDNIGMLLDNVSLTSMSVPTSIPEPGSLALLGLGLFGLGFTRRRKTKN
jgi:PEP-CTERM motif